MHVLKAYLRAGACSGGRFYLYALAAAGQKGKKALNNMHSEIIRDMKLMGCKKISDYQK